MKTINQRLMNSHFILQTNNRGSMRNKAVAYLIACMVGICMSGNVHAQADIHFSQFYETSILRNPSLAGVFSNDYKVGLYYRNQWSSISNPYTTVLISAESHVAISHTSDDFLSFGILAYSDKAGSIDQKITTFYPALNYNKCINPNNNSYLSVGFTGGYVQYSFDPSKATFNNQYLNGNFNPVNPSMENLPNATMTIWDLGAGINYNVSGGVDNRVTFIAGVSGYHFTQPKFSYYQKTGITENMRLNANTTLGVVVNDNVSMQLQGNAAMQGTYLEIMGGGLVNWTQTTGNMSNVFVLTGGVFYRYGDAIIPVAKVRYQHLALGVSYDVNLSSLKEASNLQGGAEITLFLIGDFTDKGISRKTICPKF